MDLLIIVIIAVFAIGYISGKKKAQQYSAPYDLDGRTSPKKKKGCIVKSVFTFFGLCIVAMLMSAANPESGNTGTEKSTVPPASQASSVDADKPRPTPTAKPTKAPTPEPTTLQGWAESVAESVYLPLDYEYTNLISVSCEQVDGESAPRIIINAKYSSDVLSNDNRMGNFLYNVMNVMWKLNDLAKEGKIEYGSAEIHGRTTYLDKYGNEIEGDAANILIKASEAAKVNWSYRTVNSEMIPGISTAFMIHPIIRDGLSLEYLSKIR